MEDYYAILKIKPTADEGEIRTAFKKLAIQYHPDKIRNKSDEEQEEAHRMMSLINEAYRTLIDPARKQDYDVWVAARSRGRPTGEHPTPVKPFRRRPTSEWEGKLSSEKPEDVQQKEARKREQVVQSIESLILNRVIDVPWLRTNLVGWDRAYEAGKGMKKFKVGLQAYPEITHDTVEDLKDLMSDGKAGGLGGLLGGTTAIYIVVFHDIIDHAPIYDFFLSVNRDKTRRFLALLNLRYKRIDPPQTTSKNPIVNQVLNCLWVGLD